MWKREPKKGFEISKEKKQIFIFKNDTLYWIENEKEIPQYPNGYLKFDSNVQLIV